MVAKGQMALRSNPLDALKIAEQILNGDPNNNQAHRLLAEAALALDFPRTAVLSLDLVLKSTPGDKTATLKLAEALGAAGQDQKAENILSELQRNFPADPEVSQLL